MDNISKAAEMLFGADGIGATNIRFFPGLDPKYTEAERASELVKVIKGIKDGDFKVVRRPKI